MVSFGIYIAISFPDLTDSYMALFFMLLSFLVSCFLLATDPTVTKFEFGILLLTLLMLVLSFLQGTKFKEWIYQGSSILLLIFLFRYYRDQLSPLLIGMLLAMTIAVYAGLLQLVRHPEMWIVENHKYITGYLLGGNYNGMGCRLLAAIVINIVCLRISKWFWINLIPLTICCFALLFIVRSMTSLSSLLLFIFICLFPSIRLQRLGTILLFVGVMLFQIFVCFQGNGLQDNALAKWLVVDVMEKDLTFTYRTYMWDLAIDCYAKSPIWGHGYVDGEWFLANMTWRAVGPHNMILCVLIYAGVFGLVIYFASMYYSFRKVLSVNDRIANCSFAAIVVFSLMMLMECYPFPFYFLLLVIAFYYPELNEQMTKKAPKSEIKDKVL